MDRRAFLLALGSLWGLRVASAQTAQTGKNEGQAVEFAPVLPGAHAIKWRHEWSIQIWMP